MKQKRSLLGLFVLVFIFNACKVDVVVDNPTNQEIEVSFENNFSTRIKPFGQKTLKFGMGSATVYNNDVEVGTINIEEKTTYLLNPTLSTYCVEEVGFGALGTFGKRKLESGMPTGMPDKDWEEMQKKRKAGQIEFSTIKLDSIDYSGYVYSTKELLIKKNWQYGTIEVIPTELSVQTGVLNDSRKKNFRKHDFISYHKLN